MKFTIEQIKEIWFRIYGEKLEEDYPGFIEDLARTWRLEELEKEE